MYNATTRKTSQKEVLTDAEPECNLIISKPINISWCEESMQWIDNLLWGQGTMCGLRNFTGSYRSLASAQILRRYFKANIYLEGNARSYELVRTLSSFHMAYGIKCTDFIISLPVYDSNERSTMQKNILYHSEIYDMFAHGLDQWPMSMRKGTCTKT